MHAPPGSGAGFTHSLLTSLQVLTGHPPVLKARLHDVVGRLDDHEACVRLLAARQLQLAAISPGELRPHAPALRKRLYDYDLHVREIAQALLARLGGL